MEIDDDKLRFFGYYFYTEQCNGVTEGIMTLNFTVYTYIGHCFCSIKVYVEDREASGGCITLNVKPSETVKDLKLRVGNLLSPLDMHLTTK